MSQKNDWKFIEQSTEKSSKMEPKSMKKPSKMSSKNRYGKWAPPSPERAPPGPERNLALVADRLPSVVKMKINNLQNIILQAIYLQKTNWKGPANWYCGGKFEKKVIRGGISSHKTDLWWIFCRKMISKGACRVNSIKKTRKIRTILVNIAKK